MSNPQASPGDVSRALAHRLRTARDDEWDDDRCQVEADSFFAELRHRGWSQDLNADWRALPPEPRPMSDQAFAALAEARRALRTARHQTTTTAGGTE